MRNALEKAGIVIFSARREPLSVMSVIYLMISLIKKGAEAKILEMRYNKKNPQSNYNDHSLMLQRTS